jgi:predicted ATPase
VNETDERYWEPERYRLGGELLLRQGHSPDHVESYFQQALDKAREQTSRALELRAATSIARFEKNLPRGKTEAAKEVLITVLDSFTEGADTLDVVKARAVAA